MCDQRSSRCLVFVATAEDFSEGVTFLNVRRIVLADLSPGNAQPSWALVKQRIGRALRACSHRHLPADERTLRADLFVAVHSNPHYPPTLDQEKLELVRRQRDDVESGMERLRCVSLDAHYYNPNAPGCGGGTRHVSEEDEDDLYDANGVPVPKRRRPQS